MLRLKRPKFLLSLGLVLSTFYFLACTKALEVSPVSKDGRGPTSIADSSTDPEAGPRKKLLERLTKFGYPMGSLSAEEHPAFSFLSRAIETLYPSAFAETAPANPKRKVYVQVVPSSWSFPDHNMECSFTNVSPHLAVESVNSIDPAAVLHVVIHAEKSTALRIPYFHNAWPKGTETAYETRLGPGETWNLVWGGGQGPAAEPRQANVDFDQKSFPRGLRITVENNDAGMKGLLQGKCAVWWSNGGYNYDVPVFGGMPF